MESDLKRYLKKIKENEKSLKFIFGGLAVFCLIVAGLIYYKNTQPEQFEGQVSDEAMATEAAQINLPSTHIVSPGDNLWTIAQNYYGEGNHFPVIIKANKLSSKHKLFVGQSLLIPLRYQVKPGDTLLKISQEVYGNEKQYLKILRANPGFIKNQNNIQAGWVLIIPV